MIGAMILVVMIVLYFAVGRMIWSDRTKMSKKWHADDLARGRWQIEFNRKMDMPDLYLGIRPEIADELKREDALKTLPGLERRGDLH